MSEFINGMKRSVYCQEVGQAHIGKTLTVMGWVDSRRDFGGLVFVDLRDRTGIVQVVFDRSVTEDFVKSEGIRSEYVLAVEGIVRKRSDETINHNIATGTVEILAKTMRILSEAETPPFMIGDERVNEMLRLQYRYLELRSPKLQQIFISRHKICQIARNYLTDNGFLEIETPFLGKSTPEGARDYLVPSRVHNGAYYALPQSPQLYKQLLMISGFDRYFQIARCFRDEDLRANRQPEFSQIDVEMSFIESEEDVMTVMEGMIKEIFMHTVGYEIKDKLRRMTYREAMDRFGSDKPDTRFGLEIVDITDIAKDCGFNVFMQTAANGGSVRMINAKGFVREDSPILSRRDIDALGEYAKQYRAKGMAWIAVKEDGLQSVLTKFFKPETTEAILKAAGAQAGDLLLFIADKDDIVFDTLGALRLRLAEIAGLIDKSRFDMLWVTDFPQFEYSEEEKRYVAKHHPFTSPKDEDLHLLETAPDKVRAKAYDLVINGMEAGGGSLRIYSREIQQRMFRALGFSQEQIEERFGFFVNAFKYGTPPHGGLAFGLDRLAMIINNTDNIRDVIAFPKIQNASDVMTGAPAQVETKQLNELGIRHK